MRLLVCGGRDFDDPDLVERVLSAIHRKHGITALIHGGAKGADHLANGWAMENDIAVEIFLAEWDRYGKTAGPLRNQEMLEIGKPDACVAFPGGRGTQDMVARAKNAGIDVWEISPPEMQGN